MNDEHEWKRLENGSYQLTVKRSFKIILGIFADMGLTPNIDFNGHIIIVSPEDMKTHFPRVLKELEAGNSNQQRNAGDAQRGAG